MSNNDSDILHLKTHLVLIIHIIFSVGLISLIMCNTQHDSLVSDQRAECMSTYS